MLSIYFFIFDFMGLNSKLITLATAVWLTLSPAVTQASDDTYKDVLMVMWNWKFDTYAVNHNRIVWVTPRCVNYKWVKTYVLELDYDVSKIIKDNPNDPVKWTKQTTISFDWKTEPCFEMTKICKLNRNEYNSFVNRVLSSPNCSN